MLLMSVACEESNPETLRDSRLQQPENMPLMLVTFEVFQPDRLSDLSDDLAPYEYCGLGMANIWAKFVTFEVLKLERSREASFEQPLNM